MPRSIQDDLNRIQAAIYGEEVRGSIHDAIETCYDDVTNGKTIAQTAAENANAKASIANNAAAAADAAATNANSKANMAYAAANAANEAAGAAQVALADVDDSVTAANNAALAANSAKDAANTAAVAANTAADSATSAASSANTAATSATTAATNATEAANLANTKAALADSKAAIADAAATSANTAASNANTKANLADQKATLANTKATLADQKATLADTAATAANTAASNANAKAELADSAATLAGSKASLAEAAATSANTAATNANTAAGSANSAASNATAAASTATEKANLAETKANAANTAATNATNAASSANTAAGAANTAASNCDTAATAANAAATSATTAATNANTKASLADQKATAADNAATAATAAASAANTATTAANNAATLANTKATAADTAATAANTAATAANSAASAANTATAAVETVMGDLDELIEAAEEASEFVNNKAPVLDASASGNIISITDGAEGMAIKDYILKIEPRQDLNGATEPSIDNICPIYGFTGTKITCGSRNMFDKSTAITRGKYSNGTWSADNTRITTAAIPIMPKTDYAINIDKSGADDLAFVSIECFTAYDEWLNSIPIDGKHAYTFSVSDYEVANIKLTIRKYSNSSANISTKTLDNAQLQVEFGTYPTDYVEYKSNVYNIDWSNEVGTIYGGTLNVTTGELIINRATETITKNSEITYRGNGIFTYYLSNAALRPTYSGIGAYLCNCFKSMAASTYTAMTTDYRMGYYDGGSVTSTTTSYFTLDISSDTSIEKAKEFLEDTPIVISYPLNEPQTYQLTPVEVETILGYNNIWADAGSSEIVYHRDTDSYITEVANHLEYTKSPASYGHAEFESNIATIKDGLKDIPVNNLNIKFDPIQNLNGYDGPWFGGSGKNLCNPSELDNSVTNFVWGYRGTGFLFKANVTYTLSVSWSATVTSVCIVSVDEETILAQASSGTEYVSYTPTEDTYGALRLGATDLSLTGLTVQLEVGSSPTTYTPYSNICPISGWSETTVTRCGKNLFDKSRFGLVGFDLITDTTSANYNYYRGYIRRLGYTGVGSVFEIDYTNPTKKGFVGYTPLGKPVTFSFDVRGVGSATYPTFHYADGTSGGREYTISSSFAGHRSYTKYHKDVYGVRFDTTGGATSNISLKNVQIELSDEETEYEDYHGVTITEKWGDLIGTVYSGTLNLITGVFVVDKVITTIGATAWEYDSTSDHELFTSSSLAGVIAKPESTADVADILSSAYAPAAYADVYAHTAISTIGIDSDGNLCIYNPAYTDAEVFRAAMNDVQICYTLATPVTYQISPHKLLLLNGINHFFATDGRVASVEYVIDTAGRIDRIEEETTKNVAKITNLVADKATAIIDYVNGEVATFPDGMDGVPIKGLITEIKPLQSTNGYSKPWPKGASKNILDVDACELGYIPSGGGDPPGSITSSTSILISELIPVTAGETYTFSSYKTGTNSSNRIFNYYTDGVWQSNEVETENSPGSHSYSKTIGEGINGIRISFPKSDTYVQLEHNSSKTSYVPYENVCPISGWTEGNFYKAAKNLLSPKLYSGLPYNPTTAGATYPVTESPLQFTYSNGVYTVTPTAANTHMALLLPVKVGCTYHVKFAFASTSPGNTSRGFLTSSFKVINGTNTNKVGNFSSNTNITAPNDAAWWYFVISNGNNASSTLTLTEPQVEFGSVATSYEKYNGMEVLADWNNKAGTVYGGSVNLTEAFLTNSFTSITLGASTVFSASQSGNNLFYCDAVGSIQAASGTNGYCSHFEYVGTKSAETDLSTDFTLGINAESLAVYIKDSVFSTAEELNAYLVAHEDAGTPVMIVYEVSSPDEVAFDMPVKTLETSLGTNYIWANCGDVLGLKYRADTKCFIEKLTHPTEDDFTANNNIASGKFFMLGNNLYLSTAAIAVGESIVVGTNCTAVSLADALNAINS